MNHLSTIQKEFIKFAQDMNGEVHKEQEKRLELRELPKDCLSIEPKIIKQGKLRDVKNCDKSIAYARIRMTKESGKDPQYSLGVKHLPLQQESETNISKEMFDCFYPDNLDGPQEKLRYCLPSGWDVDVIIKSDKDKGKIFAEYEHRKNEKVLTPTDWVVKN